MIKTYEVKGMSCVICKGNVERILTGLEGVNSAVVSLMDNEVRIDFDENIIDEERFFKAIKGGGYELNISKNHKANKDLIKILISIFLMAILMFVSMTNMHHPKGTIIVQMLLCILIIGLNYRHYLSGFKALISKHPNMDTLVAISSSIAFIYSLFAAIFINKGKEYHLYFETSAMVVLIVTIGKYIEDLNKSKTTKFIRGLSTLIPMQANLYNDGKVSIIPIEKLDKNDIIMIKAGEAIPQDSVVISGVSSVDESLITGESQPVSKIINDELIGGTINLDGTLIARVSKKANLTILSKIISLTKQATLTKIPLERFADKIARYFVYGVLTISILTFLYWLIASHDIELALNFALSVLVISCPCALGLATPSAIYVACSTAAKNGILIKNPEVLETTYKIKTIIFDKTGTLTKNQMRVLKYKEYDPSFKTVLGSLEASSNHPIGKAINKHFPDGGLIFDALSQIAGQGVEAALDDDIYFAGNTVLLKKHGLEIKLDEELTTIGVGKNNQLLGVVYLDDEIKNDAAITIEQLNNLGIKTIMATGDNKYVAKKVAEELNITEYFSSITPLDKQDIVEKAQKNGLTAMIGDGINDAIALSSADVSFGLNSGTDIANAACDITLMKNDLNDLLFMIKLSKQTMAIIKQNLFWALFYNAIFIPTAAGLFYNWLSFSLNPMIGSLTMTLSSIIVITNALRIANIKKEN